MGGRKKVRFAGTTIVKTESFWWNEMVTKEKRSRN